jgi:hypothetical protein
MSHTVRVHGMAVACPNAKLLVTQQNCGVHVDEKNNAFSLAP